MAIPGRGPPTFKLNGRMHHYIGQLLPHQDNEPVFAQVYIHDEEEQLRLRLNGAPELKPGTLQFWNRLMVANPFAVRFHQIGVENCPDKQYVIKERSKLLVDSTSCIKRSLFSPYAFRWPDRKNRIIAHCNITDQSRSFAGFCPLPIRTSWFYFDVFHFWDDLRGREGE